MPPLHKDPEIEATAMLLNELTIICSCCLGKKWERTIFGGRRKCGQCEGLGYDFLGPKTCEALAARQQK